MKRRNWLATAVAAMAMIVPAIGAAQQKDLLLAISEGTSGGTDHARVVAKYGGLANIIGDSIKRHVVVVFVREFGQLEDGMKANRFDFVMARPSDYPARGMRDYGYRYVAHATPDGQCLIVVPRTSSIKTLAEARGKRWVFPEKAASMAKFCNAELRDQGINLEQEKVTYVREQAAIGQYLEGSFADVGGAASYSGLARDWQKAGHTVLHRSVMQPYFPLIAVRRIDPKQVEAIQKQLLTIDDNPMGHDVLKSIGIAGFDAGGQRKLADLLPWIGKR
ncbi:MAG: phosphate transporter substrate-binding protein [Ramlibacter sp.]|jgi:phosphonate transport system substrate-binding protein|uniref:phosphate/phosphite/phosphonate ABC transporter substrate-binding protein n=1 Tax=Ramlibacter sp. TaxID=1917967 RepID=UPI002631ACA4|nr:PhnD/SsuA/transferrin family substrate-binding protein [Ramlibacter sp.]MDB5753222.1 phosphate transporter substrate-binding protein [Ramlibacter sp.]